MFVPQTPPLKTTTTTKPYVQMVPNEVADVLSLHIILSFSVVFGCVGIPRPKNYLLSVLYSSHTIMWS